MTAVGLNRFGGFRLSTQGWDIGLPTTKAQSSADPLT